MADKLTTNRQQAFLTRCNQSIDAAPSQVAALKQSLADCNANWAGYAAIEADSTELTNAGVAFAARCSAAWDNSKSNLQDALDVLASGMGTTRNALLDSMKTE